MSLLIIQTLTAVGPNITSSFSASGGTAPYSWSVRSKGAGGSIGSSTGLYTAPSSVPTNPSQLFDTVVAVDSGSSSGTAQIMVGDPLLLLCDIIQNQLSLTVGRVYLWDQKIMEPSDNGLFVAVSVLSLKPFANNNSHAVTSGLASNQSLNVAANIQIDVISRDSSARLKKEAVLLALNSDYSEQQQNANGFFIGKLPPGSQFTNLSMQDGSAIPYRFTISIMLHYVYTLTQNNGYMIPSSSPTVNYVQS